MLAVARTRQISSCARSVFNGRAQSAKRRCYRLSSCKLICKLGRYMSMPPQRACNALACLLQLCSQTNRYFTQRTAPVRALYEMFRLHAAIISCALSNSKLSGQSTRTTGAAPLDEWPVCSSIQGTDGTDVMRADRCGAATNFQPTHRERHFLSQLSLRRTARTHICDSSARTEVFDEDNAGITSHNW